MQQEDFKEFITHVKKFPEEVRTGIQACLEWLKQGHRGAYCG